MLLDGIRVIDLSNGRPPGTICTHLLADMGADVIKIEAPGGPSGHGPNEGQDRTAWDGQDRNKRSLALDLKSPAGRDAFYRLVRTADGLVESFRPGVASRLGIDFDTLHRLRPRLVYCSISGFGQDGPYAQQGLHDTEASAARGAFYALNDRVVTPSMFGTLIADGGAALHAALGLLAGLVARGERGEGVYIDVSIADSVSTFRLHQLEQQLAGAIPTPAGHLDRASFRCADGKFLVQTNTEPANWRRFLEVIGRPDLLSLPTAGGAERERGIDELRRVMATRTRDEWFAAITAAGASAARCLEPAEILEDPQVRHRGLVWELEHPTQGTVRQWGFPIAIPSAPATFRRFAPRVGEDTGSVLSELGYAASEIEAITGRGGSGERTTAG